MRSTDKPHLLVRLARAWNGRALLAVACLCLAVTLGACGGDDNERSEPAAGTSAADPTATATTQESSCKKPAGDPLRVGYIYSGSGALAVYGLPQPNAVKLAEKKINCAGGVDGRPIKVEFADHASDPNKSRAEAERLLSTGVDALILNADSASREATIPAAEKSGTFFMYPTQFEGRECGKTSVFTGEVPNQQLEQPIQYLMDKTGGKRWYIIGSDYIYPQVSEELATKYIEAAGGEVVGTQLAPFGTTDFSSSIQKIADAEPDMLLSILVGADAIAFEQQAADFGLGQSELPRLSPVYDEALVGEVGPDLLEGLVTAVSFYENADVPALQEFVKDYYGEFGDKAPRLNTYAAHGNMMLQMWAEAVNAAGSTDAQAVLDAMTGATSDTVIGPVTLEANHYLTQPVYIAEADGDGEFQVVETLDAVKPEESCTA